MQIAGLSQILQVWSFFWSGMSLNSFFSFKIVIIISMIVLSNKEDRLLMEALLTSPKKQSLLVLLQEGIKN